MATPAAAPQIAPPEPALLAVPEKLPKISGHRKAAILLACLGDEASAGILRQLTEDEVQAITREISLLGNLTPHERTVVLTDFVSTAENPQSLNNGGVD